MDSRARRCDVSITDALSEREEQLETQRRRRVHDGAVRASLPCPIPFCDRCSEEEWSHRSADDSPVLAALESQ